MAGSSLLTLIDDIATTLDDVALMTKVAAKKTAGVLGDDLALNAQQLTGFNADRELPIVWAVAKGSALNKVILVPIAIACSQFAPWLVAPLLMAGGIYLCFEGFEKIWEKIARRPHPKQATAAPTLSAELGGSEFEKTRVQGAVKTDFILSAEIIVIALGAVASAPLMQQVLVLAGTSALMTIGVYGLVALIVKFDDFGLILARPGRSVFVRRLGQALVGFAPALMKILGVAGTAAMFMVGGGILAHGIPALHSLEASLAHGQTGFVASAGSALFSAAIGVAAGASAVLAWSGLARFGPLLRRKA